MPRYADDVSSVIVSSHRASLFHRSERRVAGPKDGRRDVFEAAHERLSRRALKTLDGENLQDVINNT